MAAGKNKVERWIRVWFDDAVPTARNLSGDVVLDQCLASAGSLLMKSR